MSNNRKWTETKIARMVAEGYGLGKGANYRPWLEVRSFSSLGRSRRVFSKKTGRVHHLLSDIEYYLFIVLEWQRDIVDIREQFPLERDLTQTVANEMRARHPCYPGTQIPAVMTTDFMVTRIKHGEEQLEALNSKCSAEASNERSLEKLEMQRRYMAKLDIPHHLVFSTDLPSQNIKNVDWIRDSQLKENELEPFQGFWNGMSAKMENALSHAGANNKTLAAFCGDFDTSNGVAAGTGLRAARMLMSDRVLLVDLREPNIVALPMRNFQVTGSLGQLRSVGGQ
ncbi:MAG: hypothetical protein EAZ11_10400 [Curvibacter sp.]|nr:MAG: hypothetical protein EAZ11_10400 [Curvibacter sp.]